MNRNISLMKICKKIIFIPKSNNFLLQNAKSFLLKSRYSQKKMESAPQKKDEKELPPATLEDFIKLDIRVGEIVDCWKVLYSKNPKKIKKINVF